MKIKLVFNDWQKDCKSIYQTEKGTDLSSGSFHSGTTFDAEIGLDKEDTAELQKAIENGFTPVFYVVPVGEKNVR